MAGDYPAGRGRVRIEAGGFEIEGVSIAGHESFYKVPAFRCLLEFGRAPDDVLGYATICVTHGHLDHAAGLAHHASRRRLTGLSPARVFAPEEAVPDLEAWLAISSARERRLRGARHSGGAGGDRDAPPRLELKFLPGTTSVPRWVTCSRGEAQARPRADGLAGEEIAALREAGGSDAARGNPAPRLPGDCRPEIFAPRRSSIVRACY